MYCEYQKIKKTKIRSNKRHLARNAPSSQTYLFYKKTNCSSTDASTLVCENLKAYKKHITEDPRYNNSICPTRFCQ